MKFLKQINFTLLFSYKPDETFIGEYFVLIIM